MALIKCCFEPKEVPDVMDSIAKKCADSGCCCGCCNALRPRYKRLVDNIFPATPEEGLVKTNMEKLTFYALSSPEKLDRIGEYLYQKASRDINRRRNGFVVIAMEAIDQLLIACHAQSLNLFVESYLKMVQKLLESPDPQLQILATQSFVRFANIEEVTPSYHRRYDFFISKFSSMCHSNESETELRDSIRLAGIRGIQAVIRKTVSDDLVENIWDTVHMDKIVPSLLFNMQNAHNLKESGGGNGMCVVGGIPTEDETVDPPTLAESCLRELVGRASFGHIRSVIRPVLKHFELHRLWVPNEFATHTFRIIMFSIQAQYSYAIVETLMAHLDENGGSTPITRTSIADVLSKIIAIAASESIGPSVLEIINSLLRHLRISVTTQQSQQEEKLYQEALINALGEFANHLPDYQKIEIMMFIMSKVPTPRTDPPPSASSVQADMLLQNILLKSLLKVGTKYQTIQMNTTFSLSFLEPLLRMSLVSDPEMRLLVQKILHTLLDRHHNMEKLARANVNIHELDIIYEKASRQDLIFINKHGPSLYDTLYGCLELTSNTADNIEAVGTTLALICIELISEETVADYVQLLIGIQNMALTSTGLSFAQQNNIHAIVIYLFLIVPHIVPISALGEYLQKIVDERRVEAPHLLPELTDHYSDKLLPASQLPHLMVDKLMITECLRANGIDTNVLQMPCPYASGYGAAHYAHRHSWVEAGAVGKGSVGDLNTTIPGSATFGSAGAIHDADSASSSPIVSRAFSIKTLNSDDLIVKRSEPNIKHSIKEGYSSWFNLISKGGTSSHACDPDRSERSSIVTNTEFKKKVPEEELTIEAMKKVLSEPPEVMKQIEAEKRQHINETFRTAPFSEIMKRTQPKHDNLQNILNDIFSSIPPANAEGQKIQGNAYAGDAGQQITPDRVPIYEEYFPELFVY